MKIEKIIKEPTLRFIVLNILLSMMLILEVLFSIKNLSLHICFIFEIPLAFCTLILIYGSFDLENVKKNKKMWRTLKIMEICMEYAIFIIFFFFINR